MSFITLRLSLCSVLVAGVRLAAAAPSNQHILALPSPQPGPEAWSSGSNGITQDSRWPLDMLNAIDVLQEEYFDVWLGTWPDAIDWTAAVLGTHVPATLSAISSIEFPDDDTDEGMTGSHVREDLVNTYFSQLIAFHYGQDWLSLRTQANDDMLWVVLGWLEAITFIQSHSLSRHPHDPYLWYGQKFLPAFAHRARVFWEIASQGWDESLCGGGMVWNPKLVPYKNAITNELFIAASISMYLNFPGDDNEAPFSDDSDHKFPARASKYLRAAVKAYDWLISSNMTNEQGLFVDGFHVRGFRGGERPSNGTGRCDVRNEMVYTYNQGVILTGQRGLWEATRDPKYLDEGHELIRNVVKATGWHMDLDGPRETQLWQGLGRLGVLEEKCDILGTCSQDGQTFKGIFFLHYSAFCRPLIVRHGAPSDDEAAARSHAKRCKSYAAWVAHNAKAASMTKDGKGRFGMWWTEGLWKGPNATTLRKVDVFGPNEASGTDYRNEGVPRNSAWKFEAIAVDDGHETNLMTQEMWRQLSLADKHDVPRNPLHSMRSPEIQSGGLAVVGAATLHRVRDELA